MTLLPYIEGGITIPTSASFDGIDTSLIDPYRQGAEVNYYKNNFAGSQPKMGSILKNNVLDVPTLGFSVFLNDFEEEQAYRDSEKFNSYNFINLQRNYSYPILFNNGPVDNYEACLEPLTIPFRKKDSEIESPHYSHRVTAQLMDGNECVINKNSVDVVTQFIKTNKAPQGENYFLDMGYDNIGGIIIPGVLTTNTTLFYPFDESKMYNEVEKISATGMLESVFMSLSETLNLDTDLRDFNSKSACAGFQYGAAETYAGTDSVTFGGLTR